MCVCACACAHASTYSFIPIAREAQVSHAQALAQPDEYMYACIRTRACIHTQRRCSTHVPWRNRRWRAAVCDRGDRKQVLVGGGATGGLKESMSEEHARRWAGEGAPVELVECVTLAHVLEKSAVDVVDFMSVDVEGGERDPHTHTYTYAITHELSV